MTMFMEPRHKATRPPRRPTDILLTITAVAALAIAALATLTTDGHATEPPRGSGQAYADYNQLGRWPVDHPRLCIEDLSHGFAVPDAVAEFDGLVDMDVRTDCDAEYVVRVVTINDPGADFTAWFSTRRDDAEHLTAGLIQLNLARSYRMTPDDWRLALVHELGHAAGLSHAKQCADSVMDPTTCKYDSVGGLTDADRQQLDEIYGGAR